MQRPEINVAAVRLPNGFKVTLSTDKFARAVYLAATSQAGFFTDNYFDLIPGKKVEVEFRAIQSMTAREFRDQLRIRSMVDAF